MASKRASADDVAYSSCPDDPCRYASATEANSALSTSERGARAAAAKATIMSSLSVSDVPSEPPLTRLQRLRYHDRGRNAARYCGEHRCRIAGKAKTAVEWARRERAKVALMNADEAVASELLGLLNERDSKTATATVDGDARLLVARYAEEVSRRLHGRPSSRNTSARCQRGGYHPLIVPGRWAPGNRQVRRQRRDVTLDGRRDAGGGSVEGRQAHGVESRRRDAVAIAGKPTGTSLGVRPIPQPRSSPRRRRPLRRGGRGATHRLVRSEEPSSPRRQTAPGSEPASTLRQWCRRDQASRTEKRKELRSRVQRRDPAWQAELTSRLSRCLLLVSAAFDWERRRLGERRKIGMVLATSGTASRRDAREGAFGLASLTWASASLLLHRGSTRLRLPSRRSWSPRRWPAAGLDQRRGWSACRHPGVPSSPSHMARRIRCQRHRPSPSRRSWSPRRWPKAESVRRRA